jgi:hypothetical protein
MRKGLYSTYIKWKAIQYSNLVKEKGERIITGRSNAALWIIKSTPASENRDSASCTLLFRASSPDDKSRGNTSTPAAGSLPLHKPKGQLQTFNKRTNTRKYDTEKENLVKLY